MAGSSSFSGIGRFTAPLLGFFVFVCISLIGASGYLKIQLDRAETVLAETADLSGGGQDSFGKLRKEWGYGGFLGLAQRYLFMRDVSILSEMRSKIKAADAVVAELPESVPPSVRQETASIAALFDTAMQKIEEAETSAGKEFTAADLTPLYAALPLMDAQSAAQNVSARAEAQNKAKFWAMLLTLVSWFSLTVAAGFITAVYMIMRSRRSAPMRALAQSIENMARGDMRTAIWGIERQDMIGEVARAIDIARYHFSHLPDVSLMSEQGPVRLRFEGGARSLFEAMMKSISSDSEIIHKQSTALADTVKIHRDNIETLSQKVETILRDIQQRGQTGDRQILQAIQEMVGGAENLKNAHAHASDQLSRLIPMIEDRAQGLTEITQITGKQLTHTLQSLTSTEMSLKASAELASATLTKMSSSTDVLGERLFGAINLLQASGKLLGETTESIKSEWNNIVPAQSWNDRLEDIARQLEGMQAKLNAQADSQFGMAKALEQTTQDSAALQNELKETIFDPLAARVWETMRRVADLQKAVENASAIAAQSAEGLGPALRESVSAVGDKVAEALDRLAILQSQLSEQAVAVSSAPVPDLGGLQADIAAVGDKIAHLAELDGRVAVFVSALPGDMRQALREEIQNAAKTQEKAEASEAVAPPPFVMPDFSELSHKIEAAEGGLASRLDSQVSSFETRQQEIVDKLAVLEAAVLAAQQASEAVREEVAKPKEASLPPELKQEFFDQWFQMSAQIEAARTSLADSLGEQIKEMERRIEAAKPMVQTRSAAECALQIQIEKQTEILTELVATLGLLDAHVQQVELQKQA